MKRRNLLITIFAVAGGAITAFFTWFTQPSIRGQTPTHTETLTQPRYQKKKILNISELKPGSYIVFNWPTETERYHVNILIRGKEGKGMGQRADLYAYNLVCTHLQCQVKYDENTDMLVCPCHGSIFDPSNDANVVKGPAAKPLAKILVEEDDKGDIYAVDMIGEPGQGR
jgi:arsenite oxidase small subunit